MPDVPQVKVTETSVLRKYEGDWTQEQIDAGEAEEALVEELTLENGAVVAHWKKEA